MNLARLSPAILVALGLGLASCEATACLSLADEGPGVTGETAGTTGTGMATGSTGMASTGSGSSSGVMTGSSGADTTTIGPCLSQPETDSVSGSGSDSDSGSGSGSGSGSDSGGSSSGGMEALPGDSRDDALQRVLDRGALPADVAARLRAQRDD